MWRLGVGGLSGVGVSRDWFAFSGGSVVTGVK